jgi:hypothetical protein
MLSLNEDQKATNNALKKIDVQAEILQRVLEGEDPLLVAQDLHMAEKEVTTALEEALRVKNEFYQGNAQAYQTLIITRYEEAYRDARENAYSGDEGPSIHWFRVMLDVLDKIQKVIAPFLDEKKGNTVNIINPTILMGDDLHERGKRLSDWKDKNINDLIQGQLLDGGNDAK